MQFSFNITNKNFLKLKKNFIIIFFLIKRKFPRSKDKLTNIWNILFNLNINVLHFKLLFELLSELSTNYQIISKLFLNYSILSLNINFLIKNIFFLKFCKVFITFIEIDIQL